ncbi:restriction endonuclease subunit S [Arthrobacter sp. UYCo732]|uniref:restriction endonuclease subunit S n=1 Tax=Arthrobacter sp. UYCo732 TaxID=3156336 RepID=UPI0033978843
MSGLKPYDHYVESGAEWLGLLPEAWNSIPLKHVCTTTAGGTPDSNNSEFWTEEGGTPWIAISDMSGRDSVSGTLKQVTLEGFESKRLRVMPPGTVLFAMYASVGEVAILRVSATSNQAILGLTANAAKFESEFLFYCLKGINRWLPALYRSSTQNNLNAEQVGNFRLPLPPLSEQRAIAIYLNRETAEVDAFISDQEELIGLLNERRAATITQAVTKGLNPDAQMKDSGVEWLGKVPTAWAVKPLKHLTEFTAGGTPDTNNPELWSDVDGTPWVSISDMSNRDTVSTSMKLVTEDGLRDKNLRVMGAGTVLFAMYASVGEVAILEIAAASNQAILGLTPKPNQAETKFLFYALKAINKWLPSLYRSSTQNNLNAEQVGNFRIPTPSLDEQQEIAGYLDFETAEIDAAIADAKEAIELSKERRAALISAAVTGKIDVRNHITAELGAA